MRLRTSGRGSPSLVCVLYRLAVISVPRVSRSPIDKCTIQHTKIEHLQLPISTPSYLTAASTPSLSLLPPSLPNSQQAIAYLGKVRPLRFLSAEHNPLLVRYSPNGQRRDIDALATPLNHLDLLLEVLWRVCSRGHAGTGSGGRRGKNGGESSRELWSRWTHERQACALNSSSGSRQCSLENTYDLGWRFTVRRATETVCSPVRRGESAVCLACVYASIG